MGVAGSKSSELDAAETPSTARTSRNTPAATLHNSRGLKRRHTDDAVLSSPKKHKATGESQHIDLVFRSPKSGQSNDNTGIEASGSVAPRSRKAGATAANGLTVSEEQSQPKNDDASNGNSDPLANRSQTMIASPGFHRIIRSLHEASEEVPSGWEEAVAPPISQSQLDHNLAMIRKAVTSLKGVHLTETYTRDSLQLSTTIIPAQESASDGRPRFTRRASVQSPGRARLRRRTRTIRRPSTPLVGSVATKRPRAEGDHDPIQSHKRARRGVSASMHPKFATGHRRKLSCLWRKDDWSGWSGLLKTEP